MYSHFDSTTKENSSLLNDDPETMGGQRRDEKYITVNVFIPSINVTGFMVWRSLFSARSP